MEKQSKKHIIFFQLGFAFLFFFESANLAIAEVSYANDLNGYEYQIGNMLEWSTSMELDSKLFSIEKSTDGISFTAVGNVKAAGESSKEKAYRFLDLNANNDKIYYRLQQLDIDGTISYSPIIIVKNNYQNNFMVMTMSNTTTSDVFEITLDATIKGTMTVKVFDSKKKIVSEKNQHLINGINNIDLDFSNEKEGMYTIELTIEEEKETLVIQKIKSKKAKKENVASKKTSNGG